MTLADRIRAQRAPVFVGRDDVLSALDEFFAGDEHVLFSLWGVSGVGKTSVARHAAHRRAAAGHPVVLVDVSAAPSPIAFLDQVRRQLNEQTVSTPRFDGARQQVESLGRSLRQRLKDGSLFDEDLTQRVIDILGPELAAVYQRSQSDLSKALLEDLEDLLAFGLVIDTFEKVPAEMQEWLLNQFIAGCPDSTRILICGQRPLSAAWNSWADLTIHRELGNFTAAEVEDLLARHDASTASVDEVLKDTGGHPFVTMLYLSATRGTRPQLPAGAQAVEVADAVIARSLGQFVDSALRELLMRTAGFIHVNRDLASGLFAGNLPVDLWASFLDLPFVRRSDFGYQVHDLVFRHVYVLMAQDAPAEMAERHATAQRYWADRGMSNLAVYHCFMSNPRDAVSAARTLVADLYRVADATSFNELVALFESAAALVPEAAQFAHILRALWSSLEGRWESARNALLAAERSGGPSPVWAAALSLRIDALRYTGHLVEASDLANGATQVQVEGTADVDDTTRAALLNLCAELEGLRGRHREALRAVGLLAHVEGSSGISVRATVLFQREHLARWRGDWITALECLVEAAELLGPLSSTDPFQRGRVAYGAGRVLTYCGWFAAGQLMLQSARTRFETGKRRQNLGEALVGLSILAREIGELAASHRLLDDAEGLFTTGGTALYSAWVEANRFRTCAVDPEAAMDRAGALTLAGACGRMEYRHGQGHAMFSLDVADGFAKENAAGFFQQHGMRFEALEARVHKRRHHGQPAEELAVRAISNGDFSTAALAMDRLDDWLAYESERGPQRQRPAPRETVAVLGLSPATPLDDRFGDLASKLIGLIDDYA